MSEKKWGFKIFENYEIVLTAYGPGGSYNYNNGEIIMRVNDEGIFWKKPRETIIHEIIHIGIEESIVKKYNLEHWEKEALVDAICIKYFRDMLPEYKVQEKGNENILELIEEGDIMSLPEIIDGYKKANLN